MTKLSFNMKTTVLVAIDIAKARNDVLVELPDGRRRKLKVANTAKDYQSFIDYLKSLELPCVIGLEATANYHRTIAYHLQMAGFQVQLIAALAAARTREALHNSWDKNDPKDAQVILHLLKTGIVQYYHDPLIEQFNDIQEIAKTYHQVSLRKVRVQHSIMNHYLPLYFPEAEKYFHSSRARWFSSLLLRFPTPNSITQYTLDEFVTVAWDVSGRKVNKKNWLADFYQTAQESIGLPVAEDSQAVAMFRIVLQEHQDLCNMMHQIETTAENYLGKNPDYQHLKSIPGIGPIIALTILAEAGNLRRFNHYRQFLKFCGFDLCTHQSGCFRGQSKLSKYGNAKLRYAFWIAATVAIRMSENTFRKKFENYIKRDPTNADLKRKAYTAVAAKMARVAYSVVKNQTNYRCYFESVIPSGQITSERP
jgi:transposase